MHQAVLRNRTELDAVRAAATKLADAQTESNHKSRVLGAPGTSGRATSACLEAGETRAGQGRRRGGGAKIGRGSDERAAPEVAGALAQLRGDALRASSGLLPGSSRGSYSGGLVAAGRVDSVNSHGATAAISCPWVFKHLWAAHFAVHRCGAVHTPPTHAQPDTICVDMFIDHSLARRPITLAQHAQRSPAGRGAAIVKAIRFPSR